MKNTRPVVRATTPPLVQTTPAPGGAASALRLDVAPEVPLVEVAEVAEVADAPDGGAAVVPLVTAVVGASAGVDGVEPDGDDPAVLFEAAPPVPLELPEPAGSEPVPVSGGGWASTGSGGAVAASMAAPSQYVRAASCWAGSAAVMTVGVARVLARVGRVVRTRLPAVVRAGFDAVPVTRGAADVPAAGPPAAPTAADAAADAGGAASSAPTGGT